MHNLAELLGSNGCRFCQLRYDKEFFEFKGSNDHAAADFREVVFVGSTDTFDQAMNTEILKTTGDLSRGKVAQMMSEIFVSQPIDRILSADDDLTELLVIHGEEVESFVGSSMELFGFRSTSSRRPDEGVSGLLRDHQSPR